MAPGLILCPRPLSSHPGPLLQKQLQTIKLNLSFSMRNFCILNWDLQENFIAGRDLFVVLFFLIVPSFLPTVPTFLPTKLLHYAHNLVYLYFMAKNSLSVQAALINSVITAVLCTKH